LDKTPKILQNALSRSADLFYSGQKERAITRIAALCKKHPDSQYVREIFVKCIADTGTITNPEPLLSAELLRCIEARIGDIKCLIQAAGVLLSSDTVLNGLLEMLRTGTSASNQDAFLRGILRPVFTNKLLIGVLRLSVTPNETLELALTQLRRMMLLLTAGDETSHFTPPDYSFDFSSALAMQCWINEYVYYQQADESAVVDKLIRVTRHKPGITKNINRELEWKLLMIAMYRPLHQLDIEKYGSDFSWPDTLQPLITEMKHWQREQAIKNSI
jgi:hypothetical protein